MNQREIKRKAKEQVNWIESNDWYPYESFDSDDTLESVYLGSVLSLSPSGKYYLPFACSNVELCPKCKGTGESKHWDKCHYCNGTMTRSVADIADKTGETLTECRNRHKESGFVISINNTFTCNVCTNGRIYKTCKYCNGMGSREAFEDSLWQESLEYFAERLHNAWIESGESNLCDIFIVRHAETQESE